MGRRKWKWTPVQLKRAAEVECVIKGLEEYWPLTVRQIHYQLLSHQVDWSGRSGSRKYKNTRSESNQLSQLVKWMRIDEFIPWHVIADENRSFDSVYKHEDIKGFIEDELNYFLDGYNRCLVQDQSKYIELWVEKNALRKICVDVAHKYCINVVTCRGYNSVTYLDDFYRKASKAIMNGQEPVLFYLGDLDPSGVNALRASVTTLEEEMDLHGARFERIALNPNQVEQYQLPNDPDAGKRSDTRFPSYIEEFGHLFVELDALHPKDLQDIISTNIEAELDMEKFQEQKEQWASDSKNVDFIKRKVENLIREAF